MAQDLRILRFAVLVAALSLPVEAVAQTPPKTAPC